MPGEVSVARDGEAPAPEAALTVRAVTIACLLLPLNAYWITQMAVVRYQGHPTTVSLFFNAVFILFALRVLNDGVRRLLPRLALRRGELIVMPTDTVYGLAGDARNPDAIARIYQAKGRPEHMALPVLVASAQDALRLIGGDALPEAKHLFERFWPGELTVVVPCSHDVPAMVTAAGPACDVAELPRELLAHVGVVVDAGRCAGGVSSTVVDLSASPPRVLRAGPIPAEALREVLPDLTE